MVCVTLRAILNCNRGGIVCLSFETVYDCMKLREAMRPVMTVYAIAQLRFTDRDAYNRYQSKFMEVFGRYSGRLLAADENPQMIEGSLRPDKIVIMSFPSEDDFRAWSNSPEYLEISKDRQAGAEASVQLVKGLMS